MRVNAASANGALSVDVFGNDGVTVIDSGTLKGIDNQVDPTTGTLKLKAEFPNAGFQLWPGQFVNVRLKVDTLMKAVVVPTSAVQRGPAGTFSYVIGDGDIATAKPVVVTQQNETDAVIASGLTPADRVVTTGFANLSDGARVIIGSDSRRRRPISRRAKKAAGARRARTGKSRTARPRTGKASAAARRARAIKRVKPHPRREASSRAAQRSRSHDPRNHRRHNSSLEHLTSQT